MSIKWSEDWLNRAVNSSPYNTAFNNPLGGSGTTLIRPVGSHSLKVHSAGWLVPANASNNYASFMGDGGDFDGVISAVIDPQNKTSFEMGVRPTTGANICVILNNNHTRISLGTQYVAQTVWNITAPPGQFRIEFELLGLVAKARIINLPDNTLHGEWTQAMTTARTYGTDWYFMYAPPTVEPFTRLGPVVFNDLTTGAAPPTFGGGQITATKNGKYAATGVINSSGTDGFVYYKFVPAAAVENAALRSEVLATGTKVAWTGAAQNVSVSGLAAGYSGKLVAVREDAGRNKSLLGVSNTFTTDAPVAPPAGSTTRTISGQTVTVRYTPSAAPVSSVSMSLPVGGTPAGAVLQGPKVATQDGADWVAVFESVPAGNYGAPATLASNADNPSVSITGAAAFSIVAMDGQLQAPDADLEESPPSFLAQPTSFAVTEGQAGSISWSAAGAAPITATLYARANSGASWDAGTVVTSPHSTGNLALSENGRQHRIGLVNSVNPGAPVYSDVITVTVNAAAVPAPSITTQPSAATVTEGAPASFTVAATGSGTLSYQWFTRPAGDSGNGSNASGSSTAATYSTGNLALSANGQQYRVRVRNTVGGNSTDAFSNWVAVTVNAATPEPVQTEAYRIRMPAATYFDLFT